jgi:hypothetical protein
MKPIVLLIPTLCLAACAGQQPSSTETPSAAATVRDDALPESDDLREPSRVHTYLVNDYIDPNNPRLLHRGHAVDVVEQDEKWNLNPTDSTDSTDENSGPVTAVNDLNAAPNPYSAEFETELAQQRDQYRQLATLGAQMTAEMGKLQNIAEKNADAVSQNASIRSRLEDLQREIDEIKTPHMALVTPNPPKNASWFDWISSPFRLTPQRTTVAEPKPDFRTNLVLRPAAPPVQAPKIATTPPIAQTNAPDQTPSEPSIPSPGEMSQPTDNSPTEP